MKQLRASFLVAMLVGVAGFAMPAMAQDARTQIAQAPAATAGALGSAQFSEDPSLQCDLLEVKRISGGALMIRWRITNTAGQANASTGGFANPAPPAEIQYYVGGGYRELFYIDPAENKKYLPLTDSNNDPIAELFFNVKLQPGQQRLNWAKFPAPPPGSTKISITIPRFTPFEDVPVAQ
jgi:hypothetical protein